MMHVLSKVEAIDRKIRFPWELSNCFDFFGKNNVDFHKSFKWIVIRRFGLPLGKFNVNEASLGIEIPDGYPHIVNGQLVKMFLPKGLRKKNGGEFEFYHPLETDSAYKQNDLIWFCIHCDGWNKYNVRMFNLIELTKSAYFLLAEC
jgi:hypothetical protein